jgi:hypothetical protein
LLWQAGEQVVELLQSAMPMKTLLLAGTKKGLFVFTSQDLFWDEHGQTVRIVGRRGFLEIGRR